MPKETFFKETAIEGDEPDLTVSWGMTAVPQVLIEGPFTPMKMDRSGLNRLIATLRKARNQVFGPDE